VIQFGRYLVLGVSLLRFDSKSENLKMSNFQHGIFGCLDDCTVCLMTYLCPCYVAGKNAEAMGESCVVYGCLSMLGCIGIYTTALIRQKMREKYGIGDEANIFGAGLVGDIVNHWCCPLCSLAQEAQELKGRGDEAPAGVQTMARE